jgi:hypothetical protein
MRPTGGVPSILGMRFSGAAWRTGARRRAPAQKIRMIA